MIRRALLFAIPALIVPLVLLTLWPLGKAVATDPRMLIHWRGVVGFVLALVPGVTRILFLVALYLELTGHASPSRRQDWALAAACGVVVQIGLRVWPLLTLSSLPPQIRAQFPRAAVDLPGQWAHAFFRNILPDVIWIGFLLMFWREAAPLGRRWTRTLAFILCLLTMPPVVNNFRGVLSGIHRYLSETRERTAARPGAQGQTQNRNTALTLAVRRVAPCGSVRAGAPMQPSGTAESYCLMEPAIIDERDIATAEFDPYANDQSTIRLTLNDDAARRSIQVTGKNIGSQIAVVVNGQLVSVATIQARLGQVWIARLAPNVADRVVESFPRRHPVFPFWDRVTLLWDLVIVWVVLLAASTGLPYFLFTVGWTGPGPGAVPATTAV